MLFLCRKELYFYLSGVKLTFVDETRYVLCIYIYFFLRNSHTHTHTHVFFLYFIMYRVVCFNTFFFDVVQVNFSCFYEMFFPRGWNKFDYDNDADMWVCACVRERERERERECFGVNYNENEREKHLWA